MKRLLLLFLIAVAPSVFGASSSSGGKVFQKTNYFGEIALGNITKTAGIHKFGEAGDIDTLEVVDLWDGAEYDDALKTYTFSTSADIDTISSSNAGDTQDLKVFGLDTNWDFVTQTKTLTGQTGVALDTALIRVIRMKNVGSTNFAGSVFCFVSDTTTGGVPDDLSNVRAIVNNGNNQTLMATMSVPRNATGLWWAFFASIAKKQVTESTIEIYTRDFGSVFTLAHKNTISSNGTSKEYQPLKIPLVLPAKSDIIMKSDSSTADSAITGGFDITFHGDFTGVVESLREF